MDVVDSENEAKLNERIRIGTAGCEVSLRAAGSISGCHLCRSINRVAQNGGCTIRAIGHRVVHGGEEFYVPFVLHQMSLRN